MIAHVHTLRVEYEDVDIAGVVHHPGYLRFAERARSAMLRAHGLTHGAVIRDLGVRFALRRCAVDFLRPARIDDALRVHSRVTGLRPSRVELEQTLRAADGAEAEMAVVRVTLVFLTPSGRPRRAPAAVLAAMAGHCDAPPPQQREPKYG